MPLCDVVEAYLERITQSAKRELVKKQEQGDAWQPEAWEFYPPTYLRADQWMTPREIRMHVARPFIQAVSALDLHPEKVLTWNIEQATNRLRLLPYPTDLSPHQFSKRA